MARKPRDFAAEYARRQELARERGYRNYYDQRQRGGARAFVPGVIEPGQTWVASEAPMLPNEGPAFEQAVQSDETVLVTIRGKYSDTIVASVVYADGTEDFFTLQQPPHGYDADAGTQQDAFSWIEGWADYMDDHDIDYDIEVSP